MLSDQSPGPAPDDVAELVPVLRRAAALDPAVPARLRIADGQAGALVVLPFDVLVGRAVLARPDAAPADLLVPAGRFVEWFDAGAAGPPPRADELDWRRARPPATGWRRIETVPDTVVRDLVRAGARALKDAAAQEGVPGAQPRAATADALLDSIVLTVSVDDVNPASALDAVPVSLRTLSALTRMGFLPRGGTAAVDVAGRWTRVAAAFGSVYAERPGQQLGLRLR